MDPHTWTVDEVTRPGGMTAAKFNAYIRDQFLAIQGTSGVFSYFRGDGSTVGVTRVGTLGRNWAPLTAGGNTLNKTITLPTSLTALYFHVAGRVYQEKTAGGTYGGTQNALGVMTVSGGVYSRHDACTTDLYWWNVEATTSATPDQLFAMIIPVTFGGASGQMPTSLLGTSVTFQLAAQCNLPATADIDTTVFADVMVFAENTGVLAAE